MYAPPSSASPTQRKQWGASVAGCFATFSLTKPSCRESATSLKTKPCLTLASTQPWRYGKDDGLCSAEEYKREGKNARQLTQKKFKPLYYWVMHCNEVGKIGKRQTSALQHICLSLCAFWKWKYFLLSWMYMVFIATRAGFSLWFIAYIYPKTWIKYFLILIWKWYHMNCEGFNTSHGSLGIFFW